MRRATSATRVIVCLWRRTSTLPRTASQL